MCLRCTSIQKKEAYLKYLGLGDRIQGTVEIPWKFYASCILTLALILVCIH